MTQLPVGGPAATTYRVTSRAHVTGRVAVPAYLVTDGRATEGGPSQQVYYVSDAEIAAGEFVVAGDVHPIPIVAANNINTEYPPIPIYVVNPPAVPIPNLLYDTFTDTNNILLQNHIMNIGAGWRLESGTFDIQSNRANTKTLAVSTIASASADAGSADVLIDCIVNRAAGQGGVVFRLTDIDNCWIATTNGTNFYLIRRQAGTPTVIASNIMSSSGDSAIRVWASGSKILVTLNGVGLYTESATFNQTATRCGLYSENVSTRFDDFTVAPVPAINQTFTLTPDQLFDNGYSTDMTDFYLCSPMSRWVFTTDAAAIGFTGFNNIRNDMAQFAHLDVLVNGVRVYTGTFSANGSASFVTPLGAAGTKTVTLLSAGQIKPAGTLMGSFFNSVRFAGGSATLVTPTVPASRLVVYGDSIAVGAFATNPFTEDWAVLLRQYIDVMIEGWGSRALITDCADAAARTAFASRIVSYTPSAIWLAIGTNDYGLDLWSAANFGVAYADLLDKLHAAMPSAVIYTQTPLKRTVETANGHGSTLSDYRTEIATAQGTRSAYCTLVDGLALMTGDPAVDGVHPNTAQHAEIATNAATILSLP